jgi:hypothetical protein
MHEALKFVDNPKILHESRFLTMRTNEYQCHRVQQIIPIKKVVFNSFISNQNYSDSIS